MDKQTRNLIQKATQDARNLLESEFGEQLEGVFDILPDGHIAPSPGGHLTAEQRIIRQKIIAAIDHEKAGGLSNAEAVGSYLREASFTYLNRFVALKMLEARGLVQECLSKGEQSSGFKEFCGLAPGLGEFTDKGYRLYIESLFDELSTEIRVLFDRRDLSSLLWPRQKSLEGLLGVLNREEIANLWAEDETIGWVYQYFNSSEERKRMREESAAPRNSRELAVRNQFFTPRYVVEFLTDNTLGRIWYEMRKGDTALKEQCRYLVRRPNEVFLEEGEKIPQPERQENDLPQEEVLRQPVYIPHRPLKDPRDIKMIDPACGSMHFGLYAFDLFERIYDEAWDLEESLGPGAFIRSDGLKPLHECYENKEAFLRDVPRLIIELNIHGIDIDPRAVQIAALALWLRAQKSWKNLGVKAAERPRIAKSNIVTAEPMPGEEDMQKEFVEGLKPRVLGQLVDVVFKQMKLAGEAGSLLKIEEEIKDAIAEAKNQWLKAPRQEQQFLFPGMTQLRPKQLEIRFDLEGVTDEQFWEQAEDRILKALKDYAERVENGRGILRRLFAEDAAHGFAFIDLCRKRYDVALMNPPFGAPSDSVTSLLYSADCGNLYCAFVRRGFELGAREIGCITDRTFTTQASFKPYRQRLLEGVPSLRAFADLGWGVLDADVQVAAYVISSNLTSKDSTFSDVREDPNKADAILPMASSWRWISRSVLASLPDSVLAYTLPPEILRAVRSWPALSEMAILPRGLGSNKAVRTYLAWVEVPCEALGRGLRWEALANGGGYSPYWRQDLGVADWRIPSGSLWIEMGSGDSWRPYDQAGTEHYFLQGMSFPKQSTSFNAAILPHGFLPTREGKAILPNRREDILPLLAYLNSGVVRSFVRDTCGLHKQSGAIGRIPVPRFSDSQRAELAAVSSQLVRLTHQSYCHDETSRWFIGPAPLCRSDDGEQEEIIARALAERIDAACNELFGIAAGHAWLESAALPGFCKPEPTDILSWSVGVAFGRFSAHLTKESASAVNLVDPPSSLSPAMVHDQMKLESHGEPIFTDDPGHESDIGSAVLAVISLLGNKAALSVGLLHDSDGKSSARLREWLRGSFFSEHVKRYTIARRKAPIYWQLSTPSTAYSVWLYYHRFTKDTLYKVLNEFVSPKLQFEERELANARQGYGPSPTASQRKEIAAREAFVAELKTFRDEVARVAPLWNPNLNDGVIINFAPLMLLVPQNRSWQKECKQVWDRLVKGEYDWAHLAMHLWPERVVPKCATDRSLAIAHELDEILWEEDKKGKWVAKKVTKEAVEVLIKERNSPTVKAALEELLKAPAPNGTVGRKGKKKA